MSAVKIFVIYYDASPDTLIASEVFQPVMAGNCGCPLPPGFIGDDSGDHISGLNRTLGELTVHYWVLKNYLPACSEEYLGFCHYRRFLDVTDLSLLPQQRHPFRRLYPPLVPECLLAQWNEAAMLRHIRDYDVILPRPFVFPGETVRFQFARMQEAPQELEQTAAAAERICPDCAPHVRQVLDGDRFHGCHHFIMRRALLEEYLTWVFELLVELGWDRPERGHRYTLYHQARMPAFVMERFLSVWVRWQCEKRQLKVLEVPSYLLDFKGTLPPRRVVKQGLGLADPARPLPQALQDYWAALPLPSRLWCALDTWLRVPALRPALRRLLWSA